jgi:hypothetical protein
MPNLLKTIAKWILFTSIAVFVVGFCWIVAAAPCSNIGAYILFSSVALTALSACILLARALMVRTVDSFGLVGAIAFWGLVEFGVSSFTALMLCRGV